MMPVKIKSISLILLVIFNITHAKLPASINVCSRNDPNLEECMKNSVLKVQPLLATGKIDNDLQIMPLEPFHYESFTIKPAPNFIVIIENVTLMGSSNFTIDKLKFDVKTLTTDMIFRFPKMILKGNYNLKAKVSILDIAGKGNIECIDHDTRVRMKTTSVKYEKNNQTYVRYEKVAVRIQPGKSTVHLTNLFNGDPMLQQVGNQLINDNQDLFLGHIIPIMEKQFAKIYKNVANAIIEDATFDELFPEE